MMISSVTTMVITAVRRDLRVVTVSLRRGAGCPAFIPLSAWFPILSVKRLVGNKRKLGQQMADRRAKGVERRRDRVGRWGNPAEFLKARRGALHVVGADGAGAALQGVDQAGRRVAVAGLVEGAEGGRELARILPEAEQDPVIERPVAADPAQAGGAVEPAAPGPGGGRR